MTTNELHDCFERNDDEHMKFERIENPLHECSDLCGLLYLCNRLGVPKYEGTNNVKDAISWAKHDEIGFAWEDLSTLTEKDVIYLLRCGILYNANHHYLYSFV